MAAGSADPEKSTLALRVTSAIRAILLMRCLLFLNLLLVSLEGLLRPAVLETPRFLAEWLRPKVSPLSLSALSSLDLKTGEEAVIKALSDKTSLREELAL